MGFRLQPRSAARNGAQQVFAQFCAAADRRNEHRPLKLQSLIEPANSASLTFVARDDTCLEKTFEREPHWDAFRSVLEDAKRPEDESNSVADIVRQDRRGDASGFLQPVRIEDTQGECIALLDQRIKYALRPEAQNMREGKEQRDDDAGPVVG